MPPFTTGDGTGQFPNKKHLHMPGQSLQKARSESPKRWQSSSPLSPYKEKHHRKTQKMNLSHSYHSLGSKNRLSALTSSPHCVEAPSRPVAIVPVPHLAVASAVGRRRDVPVRGRRRATSGPGDRLRGQGAHPGWEGVQTGPKTGELAGCFR